MPMKPRARKQAKTKAQGEQEEPKPKKKAAAIKKFAANIPTGPPVDTPAAATAPPLGPPPAPPPAGSPLTALPPPAAKIPANVITSLRGAGGKVQSHEDDSYFHIDVTFTPAVKAILEEEWWNGLPARIDQFPPGAVASYFPGALYGTELAPENADWRITAEAHKCIQQYANFDAATLAGEGLPALASAAASPAPSDVVYIPHAQRALPKLLQHIPLLTNPDFPAIGSLAQGCYISTILLMWANGMVSIRLHK